MDRSRDIRTGIGSVGSKESKILGNEVPCLDEMDLQSRHDDDNDNGCGAVVENCCGCLFFFWPLLEQLDISDG